MTTTTTLGELTGDYVLDTARTRIGFVARHAMATKVRGHFGDFEGSARLDGGLPSRSGARLTIRAASIQTGNRQRDGHLRRRFLDTDEHPDITFTSVAVEQAGEGRFKVLGDLTMRGVTRPVTVDFVLTATETATEIGARGGLRVGFAGSATIRRGDWGVNWNAATGVLVSQEVTLELNVTAIRRP